MLPISVSLDFTTPDIVVRLKVGGTIVFMRSFDAAAWTESWDDVVTDLWDWISENQVLAPETAIKAADLVGSPDKAGSLVRLLDFLNGTTTDLVDNQVKPL